VKFHRENEPNPKVPIPWPFRGLGRKNRGEYTAYKSMNIAIIYICTAGAQMAIAPVPPQMGPQGPRLPQMGKMHRINENI